MITVLIASDKFKGSLTAAQVADAVGAGIQRVIPDARIDAVPVADGGDGTLAAALAAGFTRVPVTAFGPTGDSVLSGYARRGDSAVVEMADVSGLARLPGGRLEPMLASSRGTGQVVAAAVAAGCRQVVIGVGGSASTDGGAGLAAALGARLLDANGDEIGDGGGNLAALATIDLTGLRIIMAKSSVTIASDVDNPLTGPNGAAAIYGPQKGATRAQVVQLDQALAHWADVVTRATGRDLRDAPGAGAAGGVGFAGIALLDAELAPGIELILDLVGFADHLPGVDLIVTGEGALDAQTLHGKAPAGVAAAAMEAGIPVVAVCGRNTLSDEVLRAAGVRATYALSDLEPDLTVSMREGATLLQTLGERIATDHLIGTAQSDG